MSVCRVFNHVLTILTLCRILATMNFDHTIGVMTSDHVVSTMTSDRLFTTMTLDVIVALIALLRTSPVMWRKEHTLNFSLLV